MVSQQGSWSPDMILSLLAYVLLSIHIMGKFNKETIIGSGCASSPGTRPDDNLTSCGKCQFCKVHFNPCTNFTSTVTNDTFSLPSDNYGIGVACSTKNVVYLITCAKCKIQYVGMTTQQVRSRLDQHRSKIKKGSMESALYFHFLNPGHTEFDCKVQIIYRHTGDTESAKDVLLQVEEFYMRKLATLIPFGLNDHITSLNLNLSSYDFREFHSANTPFFSFAHERKRRSHGHRKCKRLKITMDYLKSITDSLYQYSESYQLHDLYSLLRGTSREILDLCLENLDDLTKDGFSSKWSCLNKILLAFTSQYRKPPKTDKEEVVYCTIPFIHKVVETVGVRELLKDRVLNQYLPHKARKFKIRTSFSYGDTIGKKVFNYNKVLGTLNNTDLKTNICDCHEKYSAFVYEPHGHVHTGKLDIIENVELRDVMSKGAKFRLTPSVSRRKIRSTLEEAILKLRDKLRNRTSMPMGAFKMWFDVLTKRLIQRCKTLDSDSLFSNNIFEKPEVIEYLTYIHDRFVIVPVDKASNNFAIVCRTFYIKVLMKELGINDKGIIQGNKVYKFVPTSQRQFFNRQSIAIRSLGNELEEDNKYVPLLYWTSKQHKDPYKFRFIAGASRCPSKTTSIQVSLALKLIKTYFRNFCNKIYKHSGINYYWSIDNSCEFLDRLKTIKIADSFETFDFSTLYTNLPLDVVFDDISWLCRKLFASGHHTAILVNADTRKAYWAQGPAVPENFKSFNCDKLLDALHYVLFNTYVSFAGNIFLQTIGIPMGGNASPFIADLCLAVMEYRYMEKLVKSKLDSNRELARSLSLNCRYLDDIGVLNFLGFDSIAKEIYHPSLLLEGSNFGYHNDNFLDLSVRIFNGTFTIGIYHKVDDFNFEVINFPFPSSNIHSQVGYNAFYSQLVRYYRLCNNRTDFVARVKMLRIKLSGRGYSLQTLRKSFLKFCGSYPAPSKYGVHDGFSLWEFTTDDILATSCYVFDHGAVRKLTKQCSIVLRDIRPKELITIPLNDSPPSPNTDVSSHSPESEILNIYTSEFSEPIGLFNPAEHCYLNAVLQIIFRLREFDVGMFSVNDNEEGRLVRMLYDGFRSNSSVVLSQFKIDLATYDSFFDGMVQRDAHECLDRLVKILHEGTKLCLVDMDVSMSSLDALTTSYPKSLFEFTLKKTYTCRNCGLDSFFFSQSSNLNVYPAIQSGIDILIENSLSGTLIKNCVSCNNDTSHYESISFEYPPKVLTILLNRFEFLQHSRKLKTNVTINKHLTFNSDLYDLVGVIEHHGNTLSSGHYTSRLYYPDAAYNCDDHNISNFNHSIVLNSQKAYITFYIRNS